MLRLLCLAIVMLPLCLAGCTKQGRTMTSGSARHVNITVDPRMELITAVEILSDYGQRTPLITQYDLSYKKDMEAYFAPYKDHAAVNLFRELSTFPCSYHYFAPINTMIRLSAPPELSVQLDIPKSVYSLNCVRGRLEPFLEELRDFARVSNFMAFYEAHREFYSKVVAKAYEQVDSVDVIAALEDYFGESKQGYNIIIVPLQTGSCGVEMEGELYNICGPDSAADDTPVIKSVRGICWHEFGHHFSNPVVAKYMSELRRDSSLFDPIASRMFCIGYGDLGGYLYEHVLRATDVRMTSINFGAERAERTIRYNRDEGFVYVPALADKLKLYETQRDKYPTFEDFFPQLVETFHELSQTHQDDSFYAVPFTGTIKSVRSDYNDVFVVPTHEADKNAQEAIRRHVERKRDEYHKGSLILTDSAALKLNLTGRSLMVFGTLSGNLWLSAHKDSLPFQIEAEKIIVGDTSYPGDSLTLIAACRNPRGGDKGVAVFTAQKAEDIPGSYMLPTEWADYVIASDKYVLKWGSYERSKSEQTAK